MEASGIESTFPDLDGVGESPLPRSATGTASSTPRHRPWGLRATFPPTHHPQPSLSLPPPSPSQLGAYHPVSLSQSASMYALGGGEAFDVSLFFDSFQYG
ncbi:uncharacterized protein CLUP02_15889 [Colletotrichum lupini]|uniref:Uncharacterized protein n=2 Tax=Colletotrichum acutatum species complex TaxID=2707335 RepID=A0A9Q8T6T2_9PEZI|nr:uncharacterized protein CLUP02_15889 [Colletotrichum lupini]UQC90359.1 hypothetical protein CLUP02_15889 [Colletotrichum lupini]